MRIISLFISLSEDFLMLLGSTVTVVNGSLVVLSVYFKKFVYRTRYHPARFAHPVTSHHRAICKHLREYVCLQAVPFN